MIPTTEQALRVTTGRKEQTQIIYVSVAAIEMSLSSRFLHTHATQDHMVGGVAQLLLGRFLIGGLSLIYA